MKGSHGKLLFKLGITFIRQTERSLTLRPHFHQFFKFFNKNFSRHVIYIRYGFIYFLKEFSRKSGFRYPFKEKGRTLHRLPFHPIPLALQLQYLRWHFTIFLNPQCLKYPRLIIYFSTELNKKCIFSNMLGNICIIF